MNHHLKFKEMVFTMIVWFDREFFFLLWFSQALVQTLENTTIFYWMHYCMAVWFSQVTVELHFSFPNTVSNKEARIKSEKKNLNDFKNSTRK